MPPRIILPKGEEMECPSTVKQSLVSMVHPLAGPALVSPDVTTAREHHIMEASPVTEGLISSDIKILVPRNSKFVKHVSSICQNASVACFSFFWHLDDWRLTYPPPLSIRLLPLSIFSAQTQAFTKWPAAHTTYHWY